MTKSITIKYCKDYDEYNVPNTVKKCTGYFTNDKNDAIGTAKKIHGMDVKIKFKNVAEWND